MYETENINQTFFGGVCQISNTLNCICSVNVTDFNLSLSTNSCRFLLLKRQHNFQNTIFFVDTFLINFEIISRRLHCARNKLHVNLFVSFLMKIILSIIKDGLVVGGATQYLDVAYNEHGETISKKEQHYVCIFSTRFT